MKKTLSIAAVTAALTFTAAPSVLAQEGETYFGVNYEMWDVDGGWDVSLLTGKYGYKFSENFAVEGKAGIGIGDDSVGVVKLDPKYTLGGFAVGTYPINEQFDIYAKAGLNIFSYDIKVSGFGSTSETETKFALGAGANYFFDNKQGVNFELFKPYSDVTTISLGYVRKF